MFPFLRSGDCVITWDTDDINPNDVVIISVPSRTLRLIKRVVAVEGQTVRVVNGRLMVDGVIVEESDRILFQHNYNVSFGPVTLKKGQVYVLGDLRNNAYDSEEMGPIDLKNIKGKVIIKWTPLMIH